MDPYPTPPAQPPQPAPSPASNWRLFLELASFAVFVFPLGHIVGPLVLWLVKKDTLPVVDEEGKKIINFNLSWTIWTILTCGVGFFVWLVIAVIAALKAANNEPFNHPCTIRFLN